MREEVPLHSELHLALALVASAVQPVRHEDTVTDAHCAKDGYEGFEFMQVESAVIKNVAGIGIEQALTLSLPCILY